ncbi:TIGR02206 family membrane protein [Nocardioides aequoreus]|uniref:YwaF family protein n=1 Tax=Nocardioides aequoreus TaxID=397278 RepID=UPI0004C3FBDA|nr:TIGR02206 family membrane protein [Nocardioides aequoreus]
MRQPLAARTFETFGADHLALVGLALVGAAAAVWWGRRLRARGVEPSSLRRTDRGVALLLVAVTAPLQVLQWLPGEWSLATSLPIQLCDLSWMLAALALWTRDPRAVQLLYYWGLTLVPQAILTPDLVEGFPHPRYLMFWGMHLLVVWVAAYLSWGPGARFTWRGYRLAVLVTLGWAASVMALNAAIGTNYGFLNAKPRGASALDLLPEWPTYVVVELLVVAAVWALMTLPWIRSRRGQGATLVGS